MKTRELHDLDEKTLREHLATARRDLFGLRMQHATGELENTAGLKTAKRDLARALTVARQRGIDPNVSYQWLKTRPQRPPRPWSTRSRTRLRPARPLRRRRPRGEAPDGARGGGGGRDARGRGDAATRTPPASWSHAG